MEALLEVSNFTNHTPRLYVGLGDRQALRGRQKLPTVDRPTVLILLFHEAYLSTSYTVSQTLWASLLAPRGIIHKPPPPPKTSSTSHMILSST